MTPEQRRAKAPWRTLDERQRHLEVKGQGQLPGIQQSVAGGSVNATPDFNADDLMSRKVVYHSGVADDAEAISLGIEPEYGDWVRQIADGTGIDDVLDESTPVFWGSDSPDWIAMKVARKLDKSVGKVTPEEILEHGHLAVIDAEDYAGSLFRVGDEGLNESERSIVTNVAGEKVTAMNTPLYEYDDLTARGRMPFGVERNEWLGTETADPALNLTGNDLAQFLKKYHPDQYKSYGLDKFDTPESDLIVQGQGPSGIQQSVAGGGFKNTTIAKPDYELDIEEVIDVGAKTDGNLVTVYHRTSKAGADAIRKSGRMNAKEDGLFFSTSKAGQAEGFGDEVVELQVPTSMLELDDIFGDEAHVRIPLKTAGAVDISKFLKYKPKARGTQK